MPIEKERRELHHQGDPRYTQGNERRSHHSQMNYLAEQQQLLEARIISNEKAIKLLVETSVADGIKAAVANPATWDAFFASLRNRAQAGAGEVTVSGFKWLVRKAAWTALAALILYVVGGWALLSTAVKNLTH